MRGRFSDRFYSDVFASGRRNNSAILRIRQKRRNSVFLLIASVYVVAVYLRGDLRGTAVRPDKQSADHNSNQSKTERRIMTAKQTAYRRKQTRRNFLISN